MADFKTPGVYIQEISTLPASVAPVATAIPAFVGYTQKRERNGASFAANKPVRITSLLEFKEVFGGAFSEAFTVTLTGASTAIEDTTITIPAITFSPYLLYYQVQMFFANGGGPCYIVSVDLHTNSSPSIDGVALETGIDALEEEDEPTILLVPEAVQLSTGARANVNNKLLTQCNKLQDRFAIMDAIVNPLQTVVQDAATFRGEVGTSNLKYGASYYPSLKTNIGRYYEEGSLLITDSRTGALYDQCPLGALTKGSDFAIGKIIITDHNLIDGDTFVVGGTSVTEGAAADFEKGAGPASTAEALATALEGATDYTVERTGNVILITATAEGVPGELALTYTDSGSGVAATVSGATLERIPADTGLYNAIKKKLDAYKLDLYPCGTMAGIYAQVDRDRGVWKAPANVSVTNVTEPVVLVTKEEQQTLNVDATSGKSINAIRQFAGKGTIVWGARTLAGNDNEWRYVPVRRLYIFVEESIQKATEFVVFEPNDANTWQRVKTMIEGFLAKLWRDGALAGAKPEDAFFVKVGLGETMTALDILEGRMNVEIGLAAVRPAEFIILKFSHKLQES